jgi:hypothetical protein
VSEDAPGGEPGARDGEVPRLPRGPLLRASGPQLFRIGMVAVLLIAVIGLRTQCGDAVAGFISSFDPPPDAGPAEGAGGMRLERLTEEQIKQRFPQVPPGAPPRGEAPGGEGQDEPPRAPETAPTTPATTKSPGN